MIEGEPGGGLTLDWFRPRKGDDPAGEGRAVKGAMRRLASSSAARLRRAADATSPLTNGIGRRAARPTPKEGISRTSGAGRRCRPG